MRALMIINSLISMYMYHDLVLLFSCLQKNSFFPENQVMQVRVLLAIDITMSIAYNYK